MNYMETVMKLLEWRIPGALL